MDRSTKQVDIDVELLGDLEIHLKNELEKVTPFGARKLNRIDYINIAIKEKMLRDEGFIKHQE